MPLRGQATYHSHGYHLASQHAPHALAYVGPASDWGLDVTFNNLIHMHDIERTMCRNPQSWAE